MKHQFRIEEPRGEVRDIVDQMVARYEGRATDTDYLERLCTREDGTLLARRLGTFSNLVVVHRNPMGHFRNMLDYAVEQHPVLRELSQPAIDGFEASVQQGVSALGDEEPQYWVPDFRGAIVIPHVTEVETRMA